MAGGEERLDRDRADIAGATGDQDACHGSNDTGSDRPAWAGETSHGPAGGGRTTWACSTISRTPRPSALAGLIRDREVSPVEVIEAAIERIEARDPSLNAFVFRGFDEAREQRRGRHGAVMAGAPLGPLHGVPTPMKDLFDFKPGWPSTFGGVRALADTVIDARCVFVERVERDGAIVMGKTNSPVMGFRGTCDNYLFGPTRNPFDTSLNAGGSSGGSAAAVADGLVPFAEGTDAGGSIRIPAAWCGLYGLKPSWGRVPVGHPAERLRAARTRSWPRDPITRTVADAALVLQTLSGYDARDPYSLPDRPDFLGALGGDLRGRAHRVQPGLRGLSGRPADRAVVAACRPRVRGGGRRSWTRSTIPSRTTSGS